MSYDRIQTSLVLHNSHRNASSDALRFQRFRVAKPLRIIDDCFCQVFVPLVMGIREEMRRAVSPLGGRVSGGGSCAALRGLRALCELRAGPRHARRPLAELIARLPSLCPDSVTTAPGREIARVSFLGPFFGVSVFLLSKNVPSSSKYVRVGIELILLINYL